MDDARSSEEKSNKNYTNPTQVSILPEIIQRDVIDAKSAINLAFDTLNVLEKVIVPENDVIELAYRLQGIKDAPVKKMEFPVSRNIGVRERFWVLNVDTNTYRNTYAVLAAQTEHLNFWVEEGVDFEPAEVKKLADVFEYQIYPTNREIFGSEWTPGVDNDDRLVILFAKELGGAAGYHSSKDAIMKQIDPYSNEAEMFYLSADYLRLDDPYTYGVLAHEFQHMIHWNIDRNESAWLNEGFSELAVELNEFPVSGFDLMFSINPDLQLNFWPGNDQGDSRPHYGSSYLFVKYFMDRFGQQYIRDLVAHPDNGLKSIDRVLNSVNEFVGQCDQTCQSEDLFQDWTIANLLQDSSIDKGIYSYQENDSIPDILISEKLNCGDGWKELMVNQFGSDYFSIHCERPFKLEIISDPTVALLPLPPKPGNYFFWSNYGDESSMQLYHKFDLSNVRENIWLDFSAWFDIERDYDYVYLTASKDGKNWQILNPPACTHENKTGANYGCGYNGLSGGWVNQRVDLSNFAGGEVHLMFEYITDAAVNGDGFAIDDISIEAIGYFTDFEKNDGGWQARGFARVSNYLPQKFAITMIENIPATNVLKNQFDASSGLLYELNGYNLFEPPRIIVSGLTRYTHQPATYQIRVEEIDQ